MPSYISSNANRFYTALESSYGHVGSITALNRIPALKLTVQQQLDMKDRKDKTGSRTFAGLPGGGRKRTNFELRTYLTSWDKKSSRGVDAFVANSENVRQRISKAYGRDAAVIYPSVDTEFYHPPAAARSGAPYYLIACALVPYKRVDLAIACGLLVTLRGGRTVEMSRRQSARLREILSL